jgi:hypothetical protein
MALRSSDHDRSHMHHANHHLIRPQGNITWPAPPPAYCEHEYEAITHELGVALKRCSKCGTPETE